MSVAKTTVGAIIIRMMNGNLNVLLTRRNVEPFKYKWCIPGGHVEPFEDAVTAVIREVKEETNLDFRPVFLTYLDEIFQEQKIHNVVLLFYGEATNELKASPDEVLEASWYSLDAALQMNLAFYHNKALELYLRKMEGENNKSKL